MRKKEKKKVLVITESQLKKILHTVISESKK